MTTSNINKPFTKPIPGLEHYHITINGDIYSVKSKMWRKSRIGPNGYAFIPLFKDGKRHNKLVHRLVLETFRPHPDSADLQCNHKDANRHNNSLSNLEWVTCLENIEYRDHVSKTTCRGSDKPNALLDEHKARLIREAPRRNGLNQYFADLFGVSVATIKYTRYGINWKHA